MKAEGEACGKEVWLQAVGRKGTPALVLIVAADDEVVGDAVIQAAAADVDAVGSALVAAAEREVSGADEDLDVGERLWMG